MQRKAIIFHGTGARPEYCWYPWLSQRLAGRGYAVEVPHYPGLNAEPIATFLPKVLASHDFDENTVLVGHWAAIKAHVRDVYFINSRVDPYGCDDAQGRVMFEQLGGTQIVRDDGHFGDADQPYETFELLDRLIAKA